MHFVKPGLYVKIVPPGLPAPRTLVYVSGVAEMAGGLGLLVPRLRRPAACGLVLLLAAVFPANIYMAVDGIQLTQRPLPVWLLWARLPLQGILMWWILWAAALSRKPGPPA